MVTCHLLAACSEETLPRTEVMVEVYADAHVAARTQRLSLTVEGGPSFDDLAPALQTSLTGPISWPVRIAIVPARDDADRVFEVTGTASSDVNGDDVLVRTKVRSGFLSRQTLLLRLELRQECGALFEECDATQKRCVVEDGAARCVDLYVDPADLPRLTPGGDDRDAATAIVGGPDSMDAGPGAMDAAMDATSARVDAGLDAGAAPRVDAGREAGTQTDSAAPSGLDGGAGAGDAGDAGEPDEPGCRIDVDGDGAAEVVPDGVADANDPCRHCDLGADPVGWTSVVCQQTTPRDACLAQTGVCDASLQGGSCEGQACCRFDPFWPPGSVDPQPACPLAGEDVDGDGVQDSGEGWTGNCNHDGGCQGCTNGGQCNDGNPCTVDACNNGACEHDTGPMLGGSCSADGGGAGRCVVSGSSAACLLVEGEPCLDAAECASDRCADGLCCDQACVGECDRCDLPGQEGSCSADHGLCADCERCSGAGTCVAQSAGQDLKDRCPAGACLTGSCNGAGACGVVLAGTDCGLCRSCDGAGSCAPNSTDHTDCGACEKCAAGACVPQATNEDLKIECPGGACLTGNCDGAGACGTTLDHTDCGPCEKCAGGRCVVQASGEDVKGACPSGPCVTGSCDGSGACGVRASGVDCGACRRCNGAGACIGNSSDHADCPTCQKCLDGSCVDQSNTEDIKNECTPVGNCSSLIRGWTGPRCERFTGPSAQNGNCSGTSASCSSLMQSCTGAVNLAYCWNAGCQMACPLGGAVSAYDEVSEICHIDWGQHGCSSGQFCSPVGQCERVCNQDGDCTGSQACCEYADNEMPCGTQPCICLPGCWIQ